MEPVDPDGTNWSVLWEHPTLPGYVLSAGQPVSHHLIAGSGRHWTLVSRNPLTLTPSLHCDRSRGGCGRHGHVRAGVYTDV